jgi:hypothetical protein
VVGVFPAEPELPAAGLRAGGTVDVTVDVPAFGTGSTAKMIAAGIGE